MTPTWYDLLGVEPDATDEEIRAAWKAGIADLEPGDRRFRTLNEAAGVLLDPQQRAAYDASLEPEADDKTHLAPPLTRQKLTGGAKRGRAVSDGSGETRSEQAARLPTHEEQGLRTTARRTVPAWVLAALAVLVVAMVAAAGYLVTQPSDSTIATNTGDAQGAAEQAAATILAYDWQTMDDDQAAADPLLTSSYREKYDKLFAVLKENQPATKTVVSVDKVVASGVVRSDDDRVEVLVFVNRSRTNAESATPLKYRDSVVMTMQHDSGEWLVDCMNTNPLGDQPATQDPC